MPKKFPVTDELLDWLEAQVDAGKSFSAMAREAGCCVDTVKRILNRHGIVRFEGAKYQFLPAVEQEMWNRPCMICKSTAARPKWQYTCDACKEAQTDMMSLPEGWHG